MLDVYKTRYKLNGEPFRLSPDHHFSFAHPSYANAEAYLKYAISQGEGFIAITGGPGTGKTTLVNGLLAGLDKTRIRVAMLSNVQLDPRNLVRMVVDAFGFLLDDATNADPVSELEQFLKRQSQKGCRAVLIVDEAQGLSSASLEELRLLSNLQHDNRLLLQVFLVGQEKLLDMVHAPGMEHLQQRFIATSHLEPLDFDETVSYVEHRLRHVGWQGDPTISEDASRLIHKFSGGVPRRINLICHRLFLYGGLKRKHALLGEDARHVINELYRERLLTPEVPGEQKVEGGTAAESKNAGLPTLSPLRTESFMRTEKARQRSMQADSEAPAAEDIIPLTRPVPQPPQHEGNESLARPPEEKNRGIRTVGAATSKSLPVEPVKPGTGPGKGRRLRLAVVSGMLAGLVLVVAVKPELGDQQAALTVAAPAGTESRIARVESVPEKENTLVSDPVLASVTNSPDRSPLTEVASMGGTSRRDSSFATSSTDLDSAPGSDTEQIDAINRGAPVTEASLNAIPRNPLKQETGGKLMEQREAERLEQGQQVVEKKLAKPPEVAGLGQRTQQKRRLEAVDEERRKQREVQNWQIHPERKETLHEAGREAALARRNKASIEIESTEESAGESEQNEMQLPTHSGVSDNKTRSEGMSPPAQAERRSTVQLTQERPSKVIPAATAVAKASQQAAEPTVSGLDRLQSLLLAGRWNSEGKPAVLLMSEVTHCEAGEKNIKCWSVPQNSSTKQGLALYKVEATLRAFATGDSFQISYRTLVKLVGGDGGADSTSDEGRWQVTENALECRFIQSDWIQCRDEKDITRDYQRSGL